MSGERRGRGRPRANQNAEGEFNLDGNMWAQMMQQNQQMMQMMQQQIQQNVQSQQQWRLCNRVKVPISIIPHHQSLEIRLFGSTTVTIPQSSMVKVNHKKLKGGLSTWRRFSEWLIVPRKRK